MKLNVKRILAGLLAGALALSVTGCASSGESSSDASNTVSAGSSTSGTDEKTTIVLLSMWRMFKTKLLRCGV